MTFHGRKGDPVRIDEPCDKVSLRGSSGKVARWIGGAWRLPSAGRYAFVLTGCEAKKKSSAQLTKIRLRPLVVNGDAKVLTYRGRGAYEDWAKVVVPHHGRVQVRPTSPGQVSPWGALYLGDAPVLNIWTWHQEYELSPKAVYLEAGAPVANSWADVPDRGATRAPGGPTGHPAPRREPGPRPRHQNPLGARHARRRGRGGGRRAALQEVGVRFASQGDHWVTAAVNGRLESRSMPSLALTGPDGSTLVGLNHATYGSGGSPELWYLPEAGSYRVTVRTDPDHQSGTLSLASVRELAVEMPTDGQPLAFTAQKPGEWVLASGQLPDQPYTLSVEAVGATSWRASAHVVPLEVCRGAFCGDGTSATLTPKFPTSSYPPLQSAGSWIFVVGFGPGHTGTVSLRLTAPPPT